MRHLPGPDLTRRRLLGALAAAVTLPAWPLVQAAAPARRLLALGPGALRLLTYLDATALLVGLEDLERRPLSSATYRYVLPSRLPELPAVGPGGPGRAPDLEQVVNLRPDLVLTCALDEQQLLALRERARVAVLPLSYGDTGVLRLDELDASLLALGQAIGREERAGQLTAFVRDSLAELARRLAGVVPVPAYIGGISMQGAHGITSTQSGHQPLVWAGAHNLADQAGAPGHLFLDREQLLVWDPPVLFVDGAGLSGILREYAKDPGYYQRLRAVREGRVYLTLPFNAYNTNVENALVNAWTMARVLHPQRFAGLDPRGERGDILRAFLGRDVTPELQRNGYGCGQLDLPSGRWTPLS